MMFGAKKVGLGGGAAAVGGGFGAKSAGGATSATPSFGAKSAGGATSATPSFGAKPAGGATSATPSFGAKPAGVGAVPGFVAKPVGSATTAPTTAAGAAPSAGGATAASGFGRTAAGFGQTAGAAGVGFGGAGVGFGGSASAASSAAASGDLAALVARITDLGNRLHPTSPYCALKFIFYNRVDPAQVRYYRRPESFDPSLWAQALQLNPDPEHLVPHQASGYPDLKARLDAQDSETGAQASALADVETFLRLKYEELSLSTALKLDQLKRDSLLLSHRVLTVSSHIEILRARGLAIQPDEDAWRQQLHNILLQLSKPNEYRGRLNELSSRVRMQQQQQQQQHSFENGFRSSAMVIGGDNASSSSAAHPTSSSSSSSATINAAHPSSSDAFSPSDLDHFTQFLQHQQTGLEYLIDILNTDVKNLQTLSESVYLTKRD